MINIIKNLFDVTDDNALIILLTFSIMLVVIISLVIVTILLSKKIKNNNKIIQNLLKENEKLANNKETLKQDIVINKIIEIKKEENRVEETSSQENIETINEEKIEDSISVDEPINNQVEEEKELLDIDEFDSDEDIEVKSGRILLGKYEVFPVKDVFLYRLKASNGEVLVVSEMYKSIKSALNAIETLKKNLQSGELQISQDKHNLWQFKLLAANKRLLVVSANYSSQSSCEKAAQSFKKFAFISQVVVLQEDPDHFMEEINLEAQPNKKGGKIIVTSSDNEYEFKLVASNGAILCSSIIYNSKNAVENAVSSFKEAVKIGTFYIVKDKNNMYQFKLYSNLGRCIAIGEAYKNKNQAFSAANSLTAYISMSEYVDKTNEEVR